MAETVVDATLKDLMKMMRRGLAPASLLLFSSQAGCTFLSLLLFSSKAGCTFILGVLAYFAVVKGAAAFGVCRWEKGRKKVWCGS